MDEILAFLKNISKNNNRTWFEKNKATYLEAKAAFEDFLESFHRELLKFDNRLVNLNPRKMGFRIYRDVRFSKDKRPYKINMGAGFSPKGKMEQEPGYYIHLEPGNKSFVAGGIYMPNSENLAKIRQEIDYNADTLLKTLNNKQFKKYFKGLSGWDKVKTAPKGYPKDHPHIELLKNKSFTVSYPLTDAVVKNPKLVKDLAVVCLNIKKLNDFLCEAIA
ncbi:MAG: DUF2461 domain-containing protein [Bacteroidetes bacterium]|nr:DUF2461 domain-containing protein [Bacteroidota bacterium]